MSKKPLLIGCSGGGGHISAIKGIADTYEREGVFLEKHTPRIYDEAHQNFRQKTIYVGANVMEKTGRPGKAVINKTPFPKIPNLFTLKKEIGTLNKKDLRSYIDMLLDVYPTGYESAAIWNILQRNDEIDELKKLVKLQKKSDADNYEVVKDYFYKKLIEARDNGTPYTEIISTQAMALPALCDAVSEYNKDKDTKARVYIHQYFTDLPTEGAVHFFNPLSGLTKKQQGQMQLHGVGLKKEVMDHFFPKGHSFHNIIDVDPLQNPMVRAGFKDEKNNNSTKYGKEDVSLDLLGIDPITVKANEQIASIMLGSQAGNDTAEYIETLLKNGMDKVFVFGGLNKNISDRIEEIIKTHPHYKDKIVGLGAQDDGQIASLMTRSNIVVVRGGGLSVMEQMAMPHHPEQMILVHHANSPKPELTSGISWEDGNVDELIEKMTASKIHAQKTSPDRAMRDIVMHRINLALKDKHIDQLPFANYLMHLSASTIEQCCKWLNEEDGGLEALEDYFAPYLTDKEMTPEARIQAQQNLVHIEILNKHCSDSRNYLSQIIRTEAQKAGIHSNWDEMMNAVRNRSDDSSLQAILTSYDSIGKLQGSINAGRMQSVEDKLKHFKANFRTEKEKILAYPDNKILQFIQEIIYQLTMIFGNKDKSVSFTFFTPVQNLRRDVDLRIPEETSPEASDSVLKSDP